MIRTALIMLGCLALAAPGSALAQDKLTATDQLTYYRASYSSVVCAIDTGSARCWNENGRGFLCVFNGCLPEATLPYLVEGGRNATATSGSLVVTFPYGVCNLSISAASCEVKEYMAVVSANRAQVIDPQGRIRE